MHRISPTSTLGLTLLLLATVMTCPVGQANAQFRGHVWGESWEAVDAREREMMVAKGVRLDCDGTVDGLNGGWVSCTTKFFGCTTQLEMWFPGTSKVAPGLHEGRYEVNMLGPGRKEQDEKAEEIMAGLVSKYGEAASPRFGADLMLPTKTEHSSCPNAYFDSECTDVWPFKVIRSLQWRLGDSGTITAFYGGYHSEEKDRDCCGDSVNSILDGIPRREIIVIYRSPITTRVLESRLEKRRDALEAKKHAEDDAKKAEQKKLLERKERENLAAEERRKAEAARKSEEDQRRKAREAELEEKRKVEKMKEERRRKLDLQLL